MVNWRKLGLDSGVPSLGGERVMRGLLRGTAVPDTGKQPFSVPNSMVSCVKVENTAGSLNLSV